MPLNETEFASFREPLKKALIEKHNLPGPVHHLVTGETPGEMDRIAAHLATLVPEFKDQITAIERGKAAAQTAAATAASKPKSELTTAERMIKSRYGHHLRDN